MTESLERARAAFLIREGEDGDGEEQVNELLQEFNASLELCQDMHAFANKDGFLDGWKEMVTNVLMHLLPSMYDDRDETFHCNHGGVLREILVDAHALSEELRKNADFADDIGSIYELFRNCYGGKGGKELGQFFTPAEATEMMSALNPFSLSDVTPDRPIVLYDPCMGTAGLLTEFNTELRRKGYVTDVRGTEVEPDTAKFACLALTLASGRLPDDQHVRRANTFTNVDAAQDVDFIPTNPPFIRCKFKDIREQFVQAYKDKHATGEEDNEQEALLEKAAKKLFKAMYPHSTGVGAGLFLQHCVYRLAPNGSCAIVLPDGELFEGQSKGLRALRKWLLETVNVSRIVKLPGGVFPNAGVKTNIVYFRKDGKTRSVEYLQSNKECTRVTTLFDVPIATIEANEWSLDDRAYAESTQQGYTGGNAAVPMVALGDVVTFKKGSMLRKCEFVVGNVPVIGGGRNPTGMHNVSNRPQGTIVVSSSGSYAGYVNRYSTAIWASDCFSVHPDQSKLSNDFRYSWLTTQQEFLYTLRPASAGQPHMYPHNFKTLRIPLPSLDNQAAYVALMDKKEQAIAALDADIARLRERIAQCDELAQNLVAKACAEA